MKKTLNLTSTQAFVSGIKPADPVVTPSTPVAATAVQDDYSDIKGVRVGKKIQVGVVLDPPIVRLLIDQCARRGISRGAYFSLLISEQAEKDRLAKS
jgi:hypothetical protein